MARPPSSSPSGDCSATSGNHEDRRGHEDTKARRRTKTKKNHRDTEAQRVSADAATERRACDRPANAGHVDEKAGRKYEAPYARFTSPKSPIRSMVTSAGGYCATSSASSA